VSQWGASRKRLRTAIGYPPMAPGVHDAGDCDARHWFRLGRVGWLIKLNVEKCKQLNVGKATGRYYYLGNNTIKKSLQPVVEEKKRFVGHLH